MRRQLAIISLSCLGTIQANTLLEVPTTHEIIQEFLKPIKFTQVGMKTFFERSFNTTSYGQEFMPFCFVHVMDFLEFGVEVEQPLSFIDAAFGMFHQKYTECMFTNPYAVLTLLEQLPTKIGHLFKENDVAERAIIKDCIRAALKRYQANPQQTSFTDTVADEIMTYDRQEPTIREVQYNLTRFSEGILNKLIWDVHEQEEVWENFKKIMKSLETMHEHNMFPDAKNLNQLYWSVINRFYYFIDCAGSQLPLECYKTMYRQINDESLSFLLLEEQEEYMKTKKDRLLEAIDDGVRKVYALSKGIVTDGIVK